MESKGIERILKLKEEQITSMDFRELLADIKIIDEYFRNSGQLDIENALKAYQKAIQLLTAARKRLMTLKKEKKDLDDKYEEFLSSIESSESEPDSMEIFERELKAKHKSVDDEELPF
jgi:exonuclease VII small subunit